MTQTPLRILLLDDDEDELLILKKVLAGAPRAYSLDWTADAEQALADIRRGGHDLYLVDYRLGPVNGLDVIRQAIDSGSKAPMILLTGTGGTLESDGVDLEALRAGAADYLDKQGLTPGQLDRALRYARERAESSLLRERLGRAREEESRLQAALAQVEEQAKRLRLLAESSAIFAQASRDPDAALVSVARLCANVLGDACRVTLLSEDGTEAVIRAYQHVSPEAQRFGQELLLGRRVPLDHSLTGKIVRGGPPWLVPEVKPGELASAGASQAALELDAHLAVRSLLVVPLRASGERLGALALTRHGPGPAYTADDQEILQGIADRAGLAIQNAILFQAQVRAREAAERAAERTGRLQATTAALVQVLTPAQVGEAVMEHGLVALGAFSGAVYMMSDDGQRLHRLAGRNLAATHLARFEVVPLTSPLPISVAVRERKALFFETRDQLTRSFPELLRVGLVPEIQALATLPLVAGGRELGAISLSFAEPRSFSAEDREFIEAIARQCAQAMRQSVLVEVERKAREQASFLAEASALLASSLDDETILQNLLKLAVPKLADWCSVEMVEDEDPRQLAVAHVDSAKLSRVRELRRKYPPDRDRPCGILEVVRTGRPALYPEITDDLLEQWALDQEELNLLRRIGIRSALILPLTAGGKSLGGMLLAVAEPRRKHDQSSLDFMMEVAHRGALALENARLYRDLQAAVHARDEFLAIAGHELKTPLAALLMHVQSLARSLPGDGGPPKLKQRLEKAAASGKRLEALIIQMLDVSRVTAGRLELEPSPVRLDDLVREVADRFSEQAERARAPISLRLEPGISGVWDPLRLDQVVTNLVSNALKYGRGKPIEMELLRQGGQAILRVIDHGIGIQPDQQRKIFERFERAVATREYGGFGLGLWIARKIVEASGGQIEVQSEPDRGATFTVKLPLPAAEVAHALH